MSDLLAIHWERKRLRIVEASTGSAIRIERTFQLDVPEFPSTSWLKNALRSNGVTAKQAVISVPREDAILRQLELPDVPDDELPLLVSFQAAARSTTSLDQLVLDYQTLPKRVDSTQRDVLLASVPRSVSDPILATVAEAGLDLKSLTVGSFALAELVAHVEATAHKSHEQRSLLVLQEPGRLELVLTGAHQPLAAHLVRPPMSDAGQPDIAKAVADISRVLVPVSPWLSDGRIDQIWMLGNGEEWRGLDAALRKQWACPVDKIDSRIDSIATGLGSENSTSSPQAVFAHAVGLALTKTQRITPQFDLIHPHQPKPKQDPRKLWMAVGSAAALLIIAAGTATVQLTISSLDSAISDLKSNDKKLDQKLLAGKPTFDAAKVLGDWNDRNVNQLQHFKQLNDLMEGTERLYVSDYKFDVESNSRGGDVLAKVTASGNARERSDWEETSQRLVDSKRYKSRPKQLTQSKNDPDYATRFELDADLLPPPKTTAKAPSGKMAESETAGGLKATPNTKAKPDAASSKPKLTTPTGSNSDKPEPPLEDE